MTASPLRRASRFARGFLFAAGMLILAVLGCFAFAWRSPIAPADPPAPASFSPGLIARGSELVAVGDCVTCHTAPGGKPFGGGLGLATPFGTIYTPNITRDHDAGIGTWSEAAFLRGMREGVSRKGNHLYPAFPYDHFTLVTDDDVKAIYAFLMTREPVHKRAPETELPFPLNYRMLLAGWKLLFFREGPFQPDAAKDDVWNRGAYLVEGLGHCGACHTPRNFLGAEKRGARYSGGEAEGWTAYALNSASPAPVRWDVESLEAFLQRGSFPTHGLAAGAMAPVVANLATVPQEDVHAIATYVASLMVPPASAAQMSRAKVTGASDNPGNGLVPASAGAQIAPVASVDAMGAGDVIYAAACSTCHESRRPPPFGGMDLRLSSALNAPTPQNAINVALFGIPAAEGSPSAIMPGLAASLTDSQITELLAYLRSHFTQKPAWNGVADLVANTRSGARQVTVRSPDGVEQPAALVGGR
jgi:mono/diheme cytochrome c family protein